MDWKLIGLGIIAIAIVGYTALTVVRPTQFAFANFTATKIETTYTQPVQKAKALYAEKKKQNTDFESSPCLTQDIGDSWAVDITHNPRTTTDDQNQCSDFTQGKVTHLIELSPDGNIIRIQ